MREKRGFHFLSQVVLVDLDDEAIPLERFSRGGGGEEGGLSAVRAGALAESGFAD